MAICNATVVCSKHYNGHMNYLVKLFCLVRKANRRTDRVHFPAGFSVTAALILCFVHVSAGSPSKALDRARLMIGWVSGMKKKSEYSHLSSSTELIVFLKLKFKCRMYRFLCFSCSIEPDNY